MQPIALYAEQAGSVLEHCVCVHGLAAAGDLTLTDACLLCVQRQLLLL